MGQEELHLQPDQRVAQVVICQGACLVRRFAYGLAGASVEEKAIPPVVQQAGHALPNLITIQAVALLGDFSRLVDRQQRQSDGCGGSDREHLDGCGWCGAEGGIQSAGRCSLRLAIAHLPLLVPCAHTDVAVLSSGAEVTELEVTAECRAMHVEIVDPVDAEGGHSLGERIRIELHRLHPDKPNARHALAVFGRRAELVDAAK